MTVPRGGPGVTGLGLSEPTGLGGWRGGRLNWGETGLGMRHATTSCWLGSHEQAPFPL